ncbi:MAG TPA: helix-turn-helix transcriptional regulator, partial [Acidimicrobiales bacterium]|nr:helix-turn-helix transcriptional regulator [Acidimicrobiales bacterium]
MSTRLFGMRRTMTPNQVVAYNVAKARTLRGWTQEQAAEILAPYLGAKLSGPSFSALERSAWNPNRIKQFSADDLLALSRGFDLPIGFFFTPPPPAFDAGLHAPDAGSKGLDPIVLLDAVLGTPGNLGNWADELLAYSASVAPMPRSKREKPSVSPSDLAERLEPLGGIRAKALLRQAFGELDGAGDVLERLAEALRLMDESAADDTTGEPTGDEAGEAAKHRAARGR